MDGVVAPLLHNKVPVNEPAVNTELPQLLVTVTVGVATEEFKGAAIPLPASLLHPFTVCVTVYVPPVVTVVDGVVAPLLHNKDPVNEPAVSTELPQLLTTVTVGLGGIAFIFNVAVFEFIVPSLFFHTARYCLLLSAIAAVKLKVLLVAPFIFVQVVPLVLDCHCTVGDGLPPAVEEKSTFFPAHTVCSDGCNEITGKVALLPVLKITSTQ